MRKLLYLIPFFLISNLIADELTPAPMQLLLPTTGVRDLDRSWADKYNENFRIIASTLGNALGKSDNLGSHIATKTLDMNSFAITSASSVVIQDTMTTTMMITSSVTWRHIPYTLPPADGTANQILFTDGLQNLDWKDDDDTGGAVGKGDSFGSHVATRTVDFGDFPLDNASSGTFNQALIVGSTFTLTGATIATRNEHYIVLPGSDAIAGQHLFVTQIVGPHIYWAYGDDLSNEKFVNSQTTGDVINDALISTVTALGISTQNITTVLESVISTVTALGISTQNITTVLENVISTVAALGISTQNITTDLESVVSTVTALSISTASLALSTAALQMTPNNTNYFNLSGSTQAKLGGHSFRWFPDSFFRYFYNYYDSGQCGWNYSLGEVGYTLYNHLARHTIYRTSR